MKLIKQVKKTHTHTHTHTRAHARTYNRINDNKVSVL
jgi:hypothetical protein